MEQLERQPLLLGPQSFVEDGNPMRERLGEIGILNSLRVRLNHLERSIDKRLVQVRGGLRDEILGSGLALRSTGDEDERRSAGGAHGGVGWTDHRAKEGSRVRNGEGLKGGGEGRGASAR
jgi:hypothetical protein